MHSTPPLLGDSFLAALLSLVCSWWGGWNCGLSSSACGCFKLKDALRRGRRAHAGELPGRIRVRHRLLRLPGLLVVASAPIFNNFFLFGTYTMYDPIQAPLALLAFTGRARRIHSSKSYDMKRAQGLHISPELNRSLHEVGHPATREFLFFLKANDERISTA